MQHELAEDSWGSGLRKNFGAVEVIGGKTVKKTVSFESGKIVIWTYKNGKPFHGSVKVINSEGDGGWKETHTDKPATFEKVPGTYKVIAEDSWGDPVVKLKFGTVEIKADHTLNKTCDFDSPPSQSAAPQASPNATASSGQETSQTASATLPQATAQNPQDIQAMAAQMQAAAEAKAKAAQTDAMTQMQAAVTAMQGNQSPQTQARQSQAGAKETHGSTSSGEISLPQVNDSQAGYSTRRPLPSEVGAQGTGNVGAPPSTADYSNVGAVDNGGGLTEADQDSEQGYNPYAGMSKSEMQAAFARDMGMQRPQGDDHGYNPRELKVGSPLTTRRHIETLNNRLDTCEEKARAIGQSDILNRVEIARGNLLYLKQRLKKRAPKDELQRLLDRCAQEVHAIRITMAQR